MWRTQLGNFNATVIASPVAKNKFTLKYQSKLQSSIYSWSLKYLHKPKVFEVNVNYRF